MNDLMKGKRGLIMGVANDHSIAWGIARTLAAQDGLYTLVLKHGDGTYEPQVIGSIVEYLFAPDDPEAVIEKMAAPSTRIVSLTITEGGYNVSDVRHIHGRRQRYPYCDYRGMAVTPSPFTQRGARS